MAQVVTPLVLALDAFQTAVQANDPSGDTLPCVYDDQLTVESGIEALRSRHSMEGQASPPNAERLFFYKRGLMQPHRAGLGRRDVRMTAPDPGNPGHVNLLKAFYAVMPLEFMYASPHARFIDDFEVAYRAGVGINATKSIEVTYPLLDDATYTYHLWWQGLEAKEFQRGDSYYKVLTGSCNVQGFWLVLRTEDSPQRVIEEIDLLIQNMNLRTLRQSNITE